MKSKLLLFIFAFAGSIGFASAQSLSPFVVSSSGGFYSNSTAQLSFTTAEMTMVTTLTAGSSILTQGFQQPFDFGVYVTPLENFSGSLGVYPNPGNGDFNLAIDSKSASPAKVVVYDALGQVVVAKQINVIAGKQIIPLHLTEFNEGIYILEFSTSSGAAPIHSFQKIQIVK